MIRVCLIAMTYSNNRGRKKDGKINVVQFIHNIQRHSQYIYIYISKDLWPMISLEMLRARGKLRRILSCYLLINVLDFVCNLFLYTHYHYTL